MLSFRYQRLVARDNTVSLEGHLIQIPPGPRRRSYFAARVWVHEFLDGSLGVRYQDQWLVRGSASKLDPRIRARQRQRELPERPPVPQPSPPRAPARLAAGSKAHQPPHPWRTWNPAYLVDKQARTESLSS